MDDRAYATFVRDSYARLFNLAYGLTGTRHDAEDLLQATLEKLYAVYVTERRASPDDPYAYARRTMTHTHVSERRRFRWSRERTGEVPESLVAVGVGDVPENRVVLQQALARLPRRQRQAVVLRHLEDLPATQVARLMQCSEGNVRRSAHEGLKALRALLDERPSTRTTDLGANR